MKLSSANAINFGKAETLNFVLGRVENISGKGDNADYQHFLLYPKCFLLVQIQSTCRRRNKCDSKFEFRFRKGRNILEDMLVTSIFSFSQNVKFFRGLPQGSLKVWTMK